MKPAAKPSAKPAAKPAAKASKPVTKRSNTETASKPNKRQKQVESESELSDFSSSPDEDGSDVEEESSPPTKMKKAQQKPSVMHTESEDESELVATESTQDPKQNTEVPPTTEDDSESELSDVLDEPPPKKRVQKSASLEAKPKAKPAKAVKAGPASAKDVGPDEAEIKRLQGWLVKCGIRKLWYKELAPYDSPKAKIKHLKDMLKDAGMDGRYSVEKAKSIKDARELAADLEAVKEGEKKWGHGDEDDEQEVAGTESRPKRRAAAATRFVDFGDSGEESD